MKIATITFALAFAQTAFSYEVPEQLRNRYQNLYNAPVIENPDGTKKLGDAILFHRGSLRILYLRGDPFEMAYQHGRLLRSEVQQGALPQAAAIVANSARNSFPQIPVLTDTIIKFIYETYTSSILNHAAKQSHQSLEQYLLEAYGMAEGSGMRLDDVIHALIGPEILQVILGEKLSGSDNTPAPLTVSECTDFAIRPAQTRSGGYIIGRNTDYPLNGSFDRFPTVIYYNPTDGRQKYMAVTSAGLHTAGVVGFNESGLYLGVHTIPTAQTSKNGHPIFDVGNRVLREAKSFDTAVQLFKSMKPAAGWTYTLVSTKEHRAASVEMTNKRVQVRETIDPVHIQTNHFMAEAMQTANLDVNASINEDTRARYDRAAHLIGPLPTSVDAEFAVGVLSDKYDPYNEKIRGLGNVIAAHTTLTSAVFDTGNNHLFVASGLAPVSLTQFIELPIVGHFDPETFQNQSFKTIENSSYHRDYPRESQAEQLYIEAKSAFETDLDPKKSAAILGQILDIDPQNAAYHYMRGLMALKAKDWELARRSMSSCTELNYKHHRLACHYYLGRIYAHEHRREDAEKNLLTVLSEAEPTEEKPLIKATQRALQKLRRKGSLRLNTDTIAIFMPEVDVVQY